MANGSDFCRVGLPGIGTLAAVARREFATLSGSEVCRLVTAYYNACAANSVGVSDSVCGVEGERFGFRKGISRGCHGCYVTRVDADHGGSGHGAEQQCLGVGVQELAGSGSSFCKLDSEDRVEPVDASGSVSTAEEVKPLLRGQLPRGKNYERNNERRQRRKAARRAQGVEFTAGVSNVQDEKTGGAVPEWRRKSPVKVVSSDSGYSSVGVIRGRCETVCSEAVSTAEQKARETLALRRVAENKVAIAKAEALVASYADEAKTEALQELSALRIAQRANEARAKSQSSWKQCEESLGSLGSTGSAGEFWMKKEIEKGRKLEKRYQQLKKQSEHLYANATQQVRDELLAMDGTVSDEDDDCAEGLEDLDEYLAQKVEAGGKSLAVMEEEFRNFKF